VRGLQTDDLTSLVAGALTVALLALSVDLALSAASRLIAART
jgi:ABC-type proline/glycine betaine transport system permease subunit